MKKRLIIWLFALLAVSVTGTAQAVWSSEKSNTWYDRQPWIVGCNFIPSTAVNELEMWQPETFDTVTIGRELGWAHNIGMNAVRVFLHVIPWESDREGFAKRVDRFLQLCSANRIRAIFVLFDDCWNPDPKPGMQPRPRTGIHNSGWMQCPGRKMHDNPDSWNILAEYEKDILQKFGNDPRILFWDLYNEPGNSHYDGSSLALLKKVYEWAWEIRPSQPLTSGIWYEDTAFNNFQLTHSDIISFHNYDSASALERQIRKLQEFGRPLVCTEYMARPRGSRFGTHLPVFKKFRVGAINWGLVAGKTNTIYAWDKPLPDGSEPKPWFHDIFRRNGSPYDPNEVQFIKEITRSR
jgi:hypothetical protein